jgi:hypothetical protein
MSFARLLVALSIVAAVAVIAVAGPTVTVVLTNGQRYNGTLLSRDNKVTLSLPGGNEMSWSPGEVAAIQFEQAQPNPAELGALSQAIRSAGASASAVALRDGKIVTGKVESIGADGAHVTVATTANGRQTYSASDIKYLYLTPQSAVTLFTPDPAPATPSSPSAATGTTGQQPAVPNGSAQPTAVPRQRGGAAVAAKVSGRQQWTPTAIIVRQGEQLVFRASGQVSWAGPQNVVGPNGAPVDPANASRYPVQSLGVGALIGRVGTGQPFPIGASSEPIAMPADGRLYLGINDDAVNDNGGTFVVEITRLNK